MKRVTLELGGKSAQIYLDDAVDRAPLGAHGRGRHDRRAGLRGGHPDARARGPQGRGGRGGQRDVRRASRSAHPTDPATLMGPVISAAPAGPVRALRRPRRGARRQGRLRRRPAGRVRARATTSSRPSSTCPTTPTRRPGTRSSGRCIGVLGYDDVDDAVRHRQRQPVRAVGPGVRRRRRRRDGGRPAAARRRGQREHLAVQRLRARRWLQAERARARARASRASATSRRSSTWRSESCNEPDERHGTATSTG